MDALSRLLMLNAPQGTIDKNCVLGSDWQLPHGAGELSVIRWHALTQGAAKLEMPGHAWTVESLASIAHMSRASFAQLFRDVSGTTPLAVLTKLRLQIAAQMFSREMLPVVVIAESVGYASESSFHKAFVREFGCTPGEYRERVRQLAP
ncbi:helix-turn-helix domain-containing protein [Escherichia coli]|nr:helix-turn-helix domain-containing protein [Escherichia coli]